MSYNDSTMELKIQKVVSDHPREAEMQGLLSR